MAKVTIGGKEINVPEMSFWSLELAWPSIAEAMVTNVFLDPMKGPAAALFVIAAGICGDVDHFRSEEYGLNEFDLGLSDEEQVKKVAQFLKRRVRATEMNQLNTVLEAMIEEAGLSSPEVGESLQVLAALMAEQNPSMATVLSTLSSSSLPASKEEAGTA